MMRSPLSDREYDLHRYGNRIPARIHGMERWVGLGVIADNLIQIGRCLALQCA